MASIKINLPPEVQGNLEIMYDLLGKVGVESFIVIFEGSDDDGQIEDPCEFKPKKAQEDAEELFDEEVKGARISDGWRHSTSGNEQIWREDPTLGSIISSICYESLEQASTGWEIDAGSHGLFYFDVKNRTSRLDLKERVVQDVEYEFEM